MPEEMSFRFRHLTEWGKDLEVMRRAGPDRWTAEQLNELQILLNANGLAIVSDAIGSLRFDLVDASGGDMPEEKVSAKWDGMHKFLFWIGVANLMFAASMQDVGCFFLGIGSVGLAAGLHCLDVATQ